MSFDFSSEAWQVHNESAMPTENSAGMKEVEIRVRSVDATHAVLEFEDYCFPVVAGDTIRLPSLVVYTKDSSPHHPPKREGK